MNDFPPGFKPLMKDESLPHQIGFKHTVGMNGSGVSATCNCGWVSNRTVDTSNSMDAFDLYRAHLPK